MADKMKDNKDAESGEPVQLDKDQQQQGGQPQKPKDKPGQQQGGQQQHEGGQKR